MQHTESTQKVFFTNDYARFRMINGNRQLNEGKIKRIIREISEGNDMLRYYPIQAKENVDRLDILDGQHRFWICKHLKRPVYYILITENKTMTDIAKVNSNVEKWKSADFINCYVQLGNENYKLLQDFQDKYCISLSVTLLMLSKGNPGVEGSHPEIGESFKDGSFQVTHMTKAVELAEMCMQFETFPNWRSRAFVIAIYRIHAAGLATISEVHQAWKKRPEMLTQQANFKAYINTLEQILNVGKQKRIVII
jgi:hypothetical protein